MASSSPTIPTLLYYSKRPNLFIFDLCGGSFCGNQWDTFLNQSRFATPNHQMLFRVRRCKIGPTTNSVSIMPSGWLTTTISRASGEDGSQGCPLLILIAVIRTSSKEVVVSKPPRAAKWHITGKYRQGNQQSQSLLAVESIVDRPCWWVEFLEQKQQIVVHMLVLLEIFSIGMVFRDWKPESR